MLPDICGEERRAVASLVARIAARDADLAEHSLACGALSAMLGRMLDLSAAQIATASILGTLHEVGTLAGNATPERDGAAGSTQLADERGLRAATLAVLNDVPVLAKYAGPAGTLFDDFVPAPEAKIVVVADIYDALRRHMPGVAGLSRRGALNVLTALTGPRIDGEIVHALIFSQRRETRRIQVSA